MKLCVIGTGYVGLVTGTCLADLGNDVIFCDIDESKISSLKKKKIPIYEPGLEEIFLRNFEKKRISLTTDTTESIARCEVIFITVGTPEDETGAADLSYVKGVAKEIGQSLNGYKVVVNKSTVPVGTEKLVASIISQESGGSTDFDVVSNPEFLREGSAVEDFMNPYRVVIGSSSKQAAEIMTKLYEPLKTNILVTDPASSEMIKYASNAFLAAKVSFINAIANICSTVGADVQKVAKGMGLDERIGSDFLQPGPGFGGSCFPKDCKALIKTADDNGYDFSLLKAVMQVNEDQKKLVAKWIEEWLVDLSDKQVGILGLAFKPETDDMRESAAIKVVEYLREKGARVKAYDPIAMENAKRIFGGQIAYMENPYDVAVGSDAVILLTHWDEFGELDFGKLRSLMKQAFFIDARNFLNQKQMEDIGFIYKGIGKSESGGEANNSREAKGYFSIDCASQIDNGWGNEAGFVKGLR